MEASGRGWGVGGVSLWLGTPAHLLARGDVDVLDAAEDAGADLGAERVPDAVLRLDAVILNRDLLLAVDTLARADAFGDLCHERRTTSDCEH